MVMVAVLKPQRRAFSNLAQSVICLALSEIVHMVLLAVADIAMCSSFQVDLLCLISFQYGLLFTGFYCVCTRRCIYLCFSLILFKNI